MEENILKSGRGGKREGAGRPQKEDKLKNRTYKTSDEEDLIIKTWLKKRHKIK